MPPTMAPTAPALTERELAAELNLSEKTLRNWRFAKRGPRYLKVSGRCVRYTRAAVDEWLAQRDVQPLDAA